MIEAVVDTNVLVSGTITDHPNSASKGVIDAILACRFVLLLSAAVLEEVQRMLMDNEVRAKHGQSEEQVLDFCRTLYVIGQMREPRIHVPPSVTRDVTDTKFVSLALEADADYLVTFDQRHLGRLKRVGRTKIVTPRAFLRVLER